MPDRLHMTPILSLRPYRPEDLPLLQAWLPLPHVQRYFGDPADWLAEIGREGAGSAWIHYFIAEVGDPVGFAQYYDTQQAPPGIWSGQPPGTVGIDFFLAEGEGQGWGTQLIARLVTEIQRSGRYRYILADPDPANRASCRVLEKNGFVPSGPGLYRRPV